jgi:putative RecB family exonuclease
MAYSFSHIKTFEQCPLKYKYHYIDGIKVAGESIESFLGNMIHKALRRLYQSKMQEREVSPDDLLTYYETVWDNKWHEGISIVRKEYSAEDYKERGKACLLQYYRRYAPFNQARTLGVEFRVDIPLEAGFKFSGLVDRLDQRKDGVLEIHDYKSSGSLPSQKEIDKDRQLALYHIGLQNEGDAPDIDLVWHYLVFNKEFRSRRSERELRMLKQEMVSKIKEVEGTTVFRAQKSPLCEWCEYQDLCDKETRTWEE